MLREESAAAALRSSAFAGRGGWSAASVADGIGSDILLEGVISYYGLL